MPRQTTLTPEAYEKIVAAVRRGNYFSISCRAAGISEDTGTQWLAVGRGKLQRSGLTAGTIELFERFARDIEKAEAEFELEQIEEIEKAARSKTRLMIKTFADGSGETTETEDAGSWQARSWIMERRSRERWGRDQMRWMEALQVLVEEGILPSSVLEVAGKGIKAVREDLRGLMDLAVQVKKAEKQNGTEVD